MPKKATKSITLEQACDRIESIRAGIESPASSRESLDQPLERDIHVEGDRLELRVGEQAVAWAHVRDFRQRIRGRLVHMGGIAAVGSHDDHRFKGYGRRVMINALRYMRANGYDVSMLYGIPNYYPKFGYAPAFPDTKFTVALRDAERVANPEYEIIDFTPDHTPRLVDLYEKMVRDWTGPIRRDREKWNPERKGLRWWTKAECRVAVDGRGVVRGYYIRHREPMGMRIMEAVVDSPRFYPALLEDMVRRAWDQRLENIEFHLSDRDGILSSLKPVGVTLEKKFRADGEQMVRVMNLAPLLEKLAPVLADRLGGNGSLVLSTNLDNVRMIWSPGKIRVEKLKRFSKKRYPGALQAPQWAVAQLVFGYATASALAGRGDLKGPGEQIERLDRLFPEAPHFHYSIDAF